MVNCKSFGCNRTNYQYKTDLYTFGAPLLSIDHIPIKFINWYLYIPSSLSDCLPQVLLNVGQVLQRRWRGAE